MRQPLQLCLTCLVTNGCQAPSVHDLKCRHCLMLLWSKGPANCDIVYVGSRQGVSAGGGGPGGLGQPILGPLKLLLTLCPEDTRNFAKHTVQSRPEHNKPVCLLQRTHLNRHLRQPEPRYNTTQTTAGDGPLRFFRGRSQPWGQDFLILSPGNVGAFAFDHFSGHHLVDYDKQAVSAKLRHVT